MRTRRRIGALATGVVVGIAGACQNDGATPAPLPTKPSSSQEQQNKLEIPFNDTLDVQAIQFGANVPEGGKLRIGVGLPYDFVIYRNPGDAKTHFALISPGGKMLNDVKEMNGQRDRIRLYLATYGGRTLLAASVQDTTYGSRPIDFGFTPGKPNGKFILSQDTDAPQVKIGDAVTLSLDMGNATQNFFQGAGTDGQTQTEFADIVISDLDERLQDKADLRIMPVPVVYSGGPTFVVGA